MDQSFDFTSYNNIKRLSEEELTALWGEYFKDKTQKSARDALIVQYIYLIRYVVGRVKGRRTFYQEVSVKKLKTSKMLKNNLSRNLEELLQQQKLPTFLKWILKK